MSRIGATLSGVELTLLNRVARASAAATLNNLHLASGQRINSAADDPATFMALSQFRSQLKVVTAAMANATAAGSMITQARTAIGQIRAQLTTIRTQLLTDEDGELTPAERAEAQANIDTAIGQINTLAGTSIDGRRVLDGSADFRVTGANLSQVSGLRVYSTGGQGPAAPTQTISGTVVDAATQAQLTYTGVGGLITSDASFTLTGDLGSASFSVTAGQSLDGEGGAAEAINSVSHQTGVVASVVGNTLTLSSVDYGTAASSVVSGVTGSFDVTGTTTGTDAVARINGRLYSGSPRVNGSRFTVNEAGLQYDIEFAAGFEGEFDEITVSGDALTFALSSDINRLSRLAIPGLQAVRLGGISGRLDQIASGGDYSGLAGNTSRALRIVEEAIGQLDTVSGSVDGFSTAAITSSSALLSAMETELTESIAATDGFNEAEEETLLAKNEQLFANGLAALTILNSQRTAMVAMLQKIAGLT